MARARVLGSVTGGKEGRYALALSALIHALILLLFAAIRIRFEFPVPRFVEVAFVSAAPEAGGSSPPALTVPKSGQPAPSQSLVQSERTEERGQPVALPRRRMVEEEEPLLRVSEQGKFSPSESLEMASPELGDKGQPRATVDDRLGSWREGKVGPVPSERPGETTGEAAQTAPSEGIAGGGSFAITGEAAQRTVLFKVIPEYPEGLNKDAVVRIRFTVLPSGLVGSAVLVTKGGDATLERLTLEAFRQWRFNPLPANLPQVEQEGIITFRWILR
ncbi:MAG: energy transducer TonB [candidate division KSB1 bacterium]|nr:energy transducer TonB [candidate division KSB1 bacterium]